MKIKKPYFWDLQKPNILSYFLLPFTLPVILNNFLLGFKKQKIFKNIKTICVGNIYVGGTGKTPLTIKLDQILKRLNYNTAVIKKFYKIQNDEQRLIKDKTKLYCFKKRIVALKKAINDKIEVALFDDGLQDGSIDYDLKFLCFNNTKGIGNGFLIPAGPLREKVANISKYDAVFLNGNENDNSNIKSLINRYSKDIPVFESNYKPTNIDQLDINAEYIIFSGIGNPESFKETVINNKLKIIKEIIFPDHYQYTTNDISNIIIIAKKLNAQILTTEKDYTKINSYKNNDIKCLKIELAIKDEQKLIDYLELHI